MTGTGLDPYGGFPVVAPGGGNYSLRIGNSSTGAQAERVRYYIHVPVTQNKYLFIYKYAVVFQNPNHSAQDQPRFEVNAYDSITGTPISCNQFTYVSASNLPGFQLAPGGGSVWYRPWTSATIELNGYGGRTVAVDFASGDCALGGHFGYGYVDFSCGMFQIYALNCNSGPTITLNAPPGFQSYKWMDSALTTVLGTTQVLTLPTPAVAKTYAVILTPYTGFGCPDTLYSMYVRSGISVTLNSFVNICLGGKTLFVPNVTTVDTPVTYQWSPAIGLSCTNCASPTATPTVTTKYKLITTTYSGCSDTDTVLVKVDTVVMAKLKIPKDSICIGEPIQITNLFSNPAISVYQWETDTAIAAGGNGKDSMILKWPKPGLKKIKLTITYLSNCIVTDSINIYVKSAITLTGIKDTALCRGDSVQQNAAAASPVNPLNYQWSPASGLSCTNCVNPIMAPATTTSYIIKISNKLACSLTDTITVRVDDPVTAPITPSKTILCPSEIIDIKNNVSNPPAGYSWSVDTATITSGVGTNKISVYWNTSGTKKIILHVTNRRCSAVDSTEVYVDQSPEAGVEAFSNACVGSVVHLYPKYQDNSYYYWNIDSITIKDTNYQNDIPLTWFSVGIRKIKLFLINKDGCRSNDFNMAITVHENPIVKIEDVDKTNICNGEPITLHATNNQYYVYEWTPQVLFLQNNLPDVTATIPNNTYITVNVTSQWGCHASSSIKIYSDACCNVTFPDAFTPNNDGKNDKFRPISSSAQTLKSFIVANRWGKIVFNSSNYNEGWDGTYNGIPQDPDIYFYFLKYVCEDAEFEKKGNFILIR
jgi:gliding motility-associated-like protein